jgi:transcriptional regulator with GAF, ATPase, and Fis domain
MSSLVDPDDGAESALRDLAGLLFARHNERETLLAVAELAHRMTPGCDALSITVLEGEQPRTSVATAEVAARIDARQFAMSEGPSIEAMRVRAPVHVEAYSEEPRWPRLRADIRAQGIESSLALPLVVDEAVIGALNIYGRDRSCFAGDEDNAVAFARQAAVTLANAVAFHRAADLAGQLAHALEHRDVIGQAKGILMVTAGVDADSAFDMLRRESQRQNRKLYEVAADIAADATHGRRIPPLGPDAASPPRPAMPAMPATLPAEETTTRDSGETPLVH